MNLMPKSRTSFFVRAYFRPDKFPSTFSSVIIPICSYKFVVRGDADGGLGDVTTRDHCPASTACSVRVGGSTTCTKDGFTNHDLYCEKKHVRAGPRSVKESGPRRKPVRWKTN